MPSVFDLFALYKSVFGNTPYYIAEKDSEEVTVEPAIYSGIPENNRSKSSIDYTTKQISLNKKSVYGKDIWFPVEFWKSNNKLIEIDCCTIAVNLSKTVIKTAVSERKGTVHEQFNTDDYKFTIKGFLIGKDRFFPEDQINQLKDIFETTDPVSLHGGYPELFLDESCRVAVLTLDFPETMGKSPWVRPFSMTCESDYIQNLIIT